MDRKTVGSLVGPFDGGTVGSGVTGEEVGSFEKREYTAHVRCICKEV